MQLNQDILYTREFSNCSQNLLEHFTILVEKPYLHLLVLPHFHTIFANLLQIRDLLREI